jgi:hypothetical protein
MNKALHKPPPLDIENKGRLKPQRIGWLNLLGQIIIKGKESSLTSTELLHSMDYLVKWTVH